jgi:hypothetical protein
MKTKDIYQLLVKGEEAAYIVEDWEERNETCDLRIRRAKTKGHVVIETDNPIYASMIKMYHPGCQVHIRKENAEA